MTVNRGPRTGFCPGAPWDMPLVSTLTRHTLSIGVSVSITGVGVAGGAAVHSTQQGAQVAHRHLLYEGGPIFPEIPPLKDLRMKGRGRIFNLTVHMTFIH